MDLVKYLQEKLDAMSPGFYVVSKERNVDADYNLAQVVVSALSGNIYKESASIPYQIEIITNNIDKVFADFIVLAKDNNGKSHTQVTSNKNEEFASETMIPYFNSPVVVDKELEIGSDKYARIVVFASVSEQENVNDIKKLVIDNEEIELLTSTCAYVTEADPIRISGQELTPSKKRTASSSITFSTINKSSVFLNKAFKIFCGQLSGNTPFEVKATLQNGLQATFTMFIGSYTLPTERGKLPAVNIGLFLYDNRGNQNA